mgnify:CR=1 FL=1
MEVHLNDKPRWDFPAEVVGALHEVLRELEIPVHFDRHGRRLHICSAVHGRRILLDPGHGGEDRFDRGRGGFVEADGVLDIALLLSSMLERAGAEVKLTREEDITLTGPERRRIAAAWRPDVFLSLHTAGRKAAGVGGPRVLYSYSAPCRSRHLARRLSLHLSGSCRLPGRGTKFVWSPVKIPGDPYLVLLATLGRVPAVLVEFAVHADSEEEDLLLDPDFRQECATGLFNGLADFFGRRRAPHRAREVATTSAPEIEVTPSPPPQTPVRGWAEDEALSEQIPLSRIPGRFTVPREPINLPPPERSRGRSG